MAASIKETNEHSNVMKHSIEPCPMYSDSNRNAKEFDTIKRVKAFLCMYFYMLFSLNTSIQANIAQHHAYEFVHS